MSTQPSKQLETFDNATPERDYTIHIETSEFTCLCPKTGQPDFATIRIAYIPDQKCVELKSLKLYLWHFRDQGIFHEDVVNLVGDHLRNSLNPRYLHVFGDFMIRGGIHTTVEVSWGTAPTEKALNP